MLDLILGNPPDDELRAVYAAQLMTRGDPRGEYIAIELQLATTPRGSEHRAALARRRAVLRGAHASKWWPELHESSIRTRHGFVETVLVGSNELDALGTLTEREPVATVEILGIRTKTLADARWQDGIRRLIVHYAGEQLRPLLDSSLGCAIEELVLATSDAELPALGNLLPQCRRLCLAGMGLRDDGGEEAWFEPLRVLAQWSHLDRLEVLDLSYSAVDDEFATLDLPALRVLRLSGNNHIRRSAAPKIAKRLSLLPALERLELIDTEIHPDDVALLRAHTQAELVLAPPPLPDRITIDVGNELEIVRTNETDWTIWLDGVPMPIRIAKQVPQQPTVDAVVDSMDLSRLVRALSMGVPGYCTEEALSINHDRSEVRYSNYWKVPSWKSLKYVIDP